ncbi:MAG: HAD-IIIA family hydrolase [Prevotellaceae bacterium]|nr:HAD-IIIA family hydrolase [Prevotellaceae bacterium]
MKTFQLPKLVITDIDGVWTDGGMYYTAQGDVMKRFSVKDGWGVIFLQQLAIPLAIFTGENSEIVTRRAEKLKIEHCYTGVSDKYTQACTLCRELGITLSEVAAIGDDLNDLRLLRAVGYSGAPANAADYIKQEVDFITRAQGGNGAFREFVESILDNQRLIRKIVESYY